MTIGGKGPIDIEDQLILLPEKEEQIPDKYPPLPSTSSSSTDTSVANDMWGGQGGDNLLLSIGPGLL